MHNPFGDLIIKEWTGQIIPIWAKRSVKCSLVVFFWRGGSLVSLVFCCFFCGFLGFLGFFGVSLFSHESMGSVKNGEIIFERFSDPIGDTPIIHEKTMELWEEGIFRWCGGWRWRAMSRDQHLGYLLFFWVGFYTTLLYRDFDEAL